MKSCDCELLIDCVLFYALLFPAIAGIIYGIMFDNNLFVFTSLMVAMPTVLAIVSRNLVDSIRRQRDLKRAEREVEGYKILNVVVSVISSTFPMIAKSLVKESNAIVVIAALGMAFFVWVNVHYYRKLLKFIDEETGE